MSVQAGNPEGPSVRVGEDTVVWYGVDTPLTYRCRVCERVVYRDYDGRPVYEVYPTPVLCSGECVILFMNALNPDNEAPFAEEDAAEGPGEP